MHTLQPKLTKLTPVEIKKLLDELNISLIQLPKIKITDPSLPENSEISEVFKIERITEGKKSIYYRVVAV
jgi:DNA-directed RNA polymerase subunit H (RpoH/RPB5)|tara:strand:- start:516 stop:725 length:210 start_codon:yes stop_codon:yes gene_type:complete